MIKAKIGDSTLRMAGSHANAPELGAQIAEKVQAMFEPSELITVEISPVLAVHGFPNTAGIAFILDLYKTKKKQRHRISNPLRAQYIAPRPQTP